MNKLMWIPCWIVLISTLSGCPETSDDDATTGLSPTPTEATATPESTTATPASNTPTPLPPVTPQAEPTPSPMPLEPTPTPAVSVPTATPAPVPTPSPIPPTPTPSPTPTLDDDGDGYLANDDCDDHNPDIHPGATETCNDVDDDCDGEVDEEVTTTYYLDEDGDGFGTDASTTEACDFPGGYAADAGDCDDTDPYVNPAGSERCNGKDDDCDGEADEGLLFMDYYEDSDGDGYGVGTPINSCTPLEGYAIRGEDCDDTNADVNPEADERCDGIDNDCDGEIDEDVMFTWYPDEDGDGYGDADEEVLACSQPSENHISQGGDCDDTNADANPGMEETCDGIDNDCDGDIDEGFVSTWYPDEDGDGYGDPAGAVVACTQPSSSHVTVSGDCDDTNAAVNPAQTEVCDGVDNDCDGLTDDEDEVADPASWYPDEDGDGYGVDGEPVEACDQPSGYADNTQDCDDSNPDIQLCFSCQDLLDNGLSHGDGFYTLQTSNGPISVYCDMSFEGGAWTVVARSTSPSTWTNTDSHALGLYEQWNDEENFSHDMRPLLENPAPGAWAEIRIYDHVNPEALDIIYRFDRTAFVAVDLDSDSEQATEVPFVLEKALFDRAAKTYSVGDTRRFVFRIGQADSYADQYCNEGGTRSFINFSTGDENFVHATVCSHGLGVYQDAANPPVYNDDDAGRRISVAVRFQADTGMLGSESNPAASCAEIKEADADAPSGIYWIAPGGGDPVQAYCDQETVGGGWTRCAIVDYLPDRSTVIYRVGSATSLEYVGDSYLGPGGTQAIKEACFSLYDEVGLGLTHMVEGGIEGTPTYAYWWEIPSVAPDQNVAFVNEMAPYSCGDLDNLPSLPISYPNAAPRWLTAGDGVTKFSCYVDGNYSGASRGWWMTLESYTDDTWLELSDDKFDRLGVRTSSTNTKLAGVLEYWVR